MQRVIIDTNVFVSALIKKSIPNRIVDELFIEGKIALSISEGLMKEYFDVLKRDKFSRYTDFTINAEILLARIEAKGIKFSPRIKLTLISDAGDNKLLELADECNADFLITGNSNDFTMKKYKKTKIVTPAIYWQKYRPV